MSIDTFGRCIGLKARRTLYVMQTILLRGKRYIKGRRCSQIMPNIREGQFSWLLVYDLLVMFD